MLFCESRPAQPRIFTILQPFPLPSVALAHLPNQSVGGTLPRLLTSFTR